MHVLVSHPTVGSLWLSRCEVRDGEVIGDAWIYVARSELLPADCCAEWVPMHFPVSCVRQDPDGLLKELVG